MKASFMVAAGFALGLVATAPVSAADVIEREVTEKKTTTTYSGTVSEINPSGSTIILKSESGPPTTYHYSKTTTFVDEAGNTVSYETIRNQPVTVYYTKEGNDMVVSKVIVTRPTGGVIQKREERIEREETR
jgi:hypothetical protein